MAKKVWLQLEGNANDSSGNGYHFTEVASPTYENGKIGRAINFGSTNTSKFLKRTSGIGLSNGGNVTVMGWVKSLITPPSGTNSALFLVKVGTASTDDWYAISYADIGGGQQALVAQRYLNGVHTIRYFTRKTITLTTDLWYHLAFTIVQTGSGAGTMKIYLDGELLSTSESTDSYNVTGGDIINIGVWSEGSVYNSHARFAIDEVKIFDTALTQQEIKNEMFDSDNFFLFFP